MKTHFPFYGVQVLLSIAVFVLLDKMLLDGVRFAATTLAANQIHVQPGVFARLALVAPTGVFFGLFLVVCVLLGILVRYRDWDVTLVLVIESAFIATFVSVVYYLVLFRPFVELQIYLHGNG